MDDLQATLAIGFLRTALALRPNAAIVNGQLALALYRDGRTEEAIPYMERSTQIAPKNPLAQRGLGYGLMKADKLDKAVERLRQVVALSPHDWDARRGLRNALIRQGRLEEAWAAWRQTLDEGPPEHDAWNGFAELCLFTGREAEYLENRRALLFRFGASEDRLVCERTARACLVSQGTANEIAAAAVLADRAVGAGPSGDEVAYPFYLFAQGLARYRQGQFDIAMELMRGEVTKVELLVPCPRLITALALHQKGQKDEALRTLAEAIVSYDWNPAKAAEGRHPWINHILRREAEAVILPALPAFLRGEHQPQTNNERLALLGYCRANELRVTMARLYAAAFDADPDLTTDLQAGHSLRAACAAAAAGCGNGADSSALGTTGRAQLRKQARDWLRLNLVALTNKLNTGDLADRTLALKALTQMRDEPDLNGLRESSALVALPAIERDEFAALWHDVETTRKRALNSN